MSHRRTPVAPASPPAQPTRSACLRSPFYAQTRPLERLCRSDDFYSSQIALTTRFRDMRVVNMPMDFRRASEDPGLDPPSQEHTGRNGASGGGNRHASVSRVRGRRSFAGRIRLCRRQPAHVYAVDTPGRSGSESIPLANQPKLRSVSGGRLGSAGGRGSPGVGCWALLSVNELAWGVGGRDGR